MADQVYRKGLDPIYGGMFEGEKNGCLQTDSEWWVHAEAAVGFFNAYTLTGKRHYLDAVLSVWQFIRNHLSDQKDGEWFWGVNCNSSHPFNSI